MGSVTVTDPQSGRGYNYSGLVYISGSSYIRFTDFIITRSLGTGVLTQNSHHITFDKLDINNSRGSAYRYYASTDGAFTNSKVHHNANFATYSRSASVLNWPVIVMTPAGSERNVFSNLTIYENWGEGIESGPDSVVENSHLYDNYALQIYANGHKKVTVQKNFVHCSNSMYYRGGKPSEGIVINKEISSGGEVAADIGVLNNIVVGCGSGLSIWAQAGIGVENALFAHNTLLNIPGAAISVSNSAMHKNVKFINNIVQNTGGIVEGAATGIIFSDNIWNGASGPIGNNNKQTDPKLINPGASLQLAKPENYKISMDSPAINKAATSVVIDDFFGVSRPQGSASDIGAYEYIPSVSPLPTATPTGSCEKKPFGDANCDSYINLADFEIFRKEYISNIGSKTADFNGNGIVDIADFEVWRQEVMRLLNITETPAAK